MASNDLFDFMLSATNDMAEEYDRIQKRAIEDPGTAGDQGEENWASLFRSWLPSYFSVVTKGRILSHEGLASPQIDVLVLSPSYPRHLLDKKVYLAGGVVAGFECKISLKRKHIEEVLQNSVVIRSHFQNRTGTPYKELHSPMIYGLLAHSHSWKAESSTPLDNVNRHLWEYDIAHIKHPREMLDLICVADLATWVSSKTSFIGPTTCGSNWEKAKELVGPTGSVVTGYLAHAHSTHRQITGFTPIGTMLALLFSRLAFEHAAMRDMALYFRLANLAGSGEGKTRNWPLEIFSGQTRKRV